MSELKFKEVLRSTGEKQVLLIFLRHFGCPFCRETLTKLAEIKPVIEAENAEIVLVHMSSKYVAQKLLNVYHLENVTHISDPDLKLYQEFGLPKTNFLALLHPKNLWRTFKTSILKGHLMGKPAGDIYQMPGVFVFHNNNIINKFRYRFISDMPDFVQLVM